MKSYIVIGLGRFGKSLARTLTEMGHEVLGVDKDEKIVQDFSGHLTHGVQADASSEDFLLSMDIRKFDAVVVAVGDDIQSSVLITVLLKDLGAKYILAKAQDDLQAKVLYKIGADNVVLPERDMGIKAAHNLASKDLYDLIELSKEYSIVNLRPPECWYGKSVGELNVREKYHINIIAIKSETDTNVFPTAATIIGKNDLLTVVGHDTSIKKLERL